MQGSDVSLEGLPAIDEPNEEGVKAKQKIDEGKTVGTIRITIPENGRCKRVVSGEIGMGHVKRVMREMPKAYLVTRRDLWRK